MTALVVSWLTCSISWRGQRCSLTHSASDSVVTTSLTYLWGLRFKTRSCHMYLSQRAALDSGALLEGQTQSFRVINSPGLLSPTRHREVQGCEIWGVPATENFLSLQDYVWTRPLLAPSKDSETMGTCFFQRWEDFENVCRFRWKPLSYVLTSRSRRPSWSLPASNGCNW